MTFLSALQIKVRYCYSMLWLNRLFVSLKQLSNTCVECCIRPVDVTMASSQALHDLSASAETWGQAGWPEWGPRLELKHEGRRNDRGETPGSSWGTRTGMMTWVRPSARAEIQRQVRLFVSREFNYTIWYYIVWSLIWCDIVCYSVIYCDI